MKKKRMMRCMLLTLVLICSACGNNAGNNTESNSGSSSTGNMDTNVSAANDGSTHISVGIDQDPGTLAPYVSTGSPGGRAQTVYNGLYETLFMIQGIGGEMKGVLAKGYEEVDTNVYRIEIYDYIYDSAGNHYTAQDAVFCLETQVAATPTGIYAYFDSVRLIDEYTFELTMNYNSPGLFERIMYQTYMVTQAAYEASPDEMATTPVSTGPYVLKEWKTGSSLTMQVRDDYWQTDESLVVNFSHSNVDEIEFLIIKEQAQQAIGLETGYIDVVAGLSVSEAERFFDTDYYTQENVDNLCQVLFFNSNPSSPCSNIALRKAIAYCFDSQGFVDGAADGYGVTTRFYGSTQLSDHVPAWLEGDYYDYDKEKALELLAEAGYGNGGLSLRILCNNSDMHVRMAQVLQGYLMDIGIDSVINSYEDTLFNTYRYEPEEYDLQINNNGTGDFLIRSWSNNLNPTVPNCMGLTAEETTLLALLNDATSTQTWSPETMTAVHEYITEQCYVLGLFNATSYTVGTGVLEEQAINSSGWLAPNSCIYEWN